MTHPGIIPYLPEEGTIEHAGVIDNPARRLDDGEKAPKNGTVSGKIRNKRNMTMIAMALRDKKKLYFSPSMLYNTLR